MPIKLSHLGLLKITGPDAKKLLQGQLTCDMNEISIAENRLAAHCTPQGRIISLFRVFLFQDDYLLEMPKEMLPIAESALNKYAAFYKVNLSDATDEFLQLGHYEEGFRYITITLNHQEIIPENMTIEEWRALELKDGIPAIYPETSQLFLPHELNLPQLHAVSFKKGCYTGQEIIARMEYRGKKMKNQLIPMTIQIATPPRRGDDMFNEEGLLGSVVDFVQTHHHLYELLVLLEEK